MFRRVATIGGMMALAAATLPADFSYQQTSTITGGVMASMMKIAGAFSKQAREPIRSTTAVQGDRMVHRTSTQATVIDLASQTITNIDLQKRTYSVMTFDEMKQAMEQLQQKMKQNDKAEMSFKVSVDNTGKTRQIAGFEAKEMVLRMEMESTDKKSGQKGSMVITTDSWIAPSVPGYNEVRDFNRRMAEKLNWTPGGNMFMSNPDVAKGMAEVYKESAKLDGVPMLQTVTMGAGGQPGAAPPPPQQEQQQQQAERPSVGGALGGALGRFGGLGKKNPPKEEPAASGNASAPGSLLEMTMEMSDFSSNAVDASQFAVPAGFKKVEPALKK